MKLSVIFLAKTDSSSLFEMTLACIQSLLDSEPDIENEIILVESNKNYIKSGFKYPDFVNVIVPVTPFNFHQFLNIGIRTATGDYIALCNNDLIFQPYWFTAILEIGNQHQDILSFSPVGVAPTNIAPEKYALGYKVMTHIKGWCIIAKKELFQKIGPLDETFDFYYADNDYAMTLKSQGIKHALVYDSYVVHLEKKSSSQTKKSSNVPHLFLKKYEIPNYLMHEQYQWVLENEKNLSGFLKFHNKWGSPNFLYKKNKLADILIKYKLQFLIRYFFKMK